MKSLMTTYEFIQHFNSIHPDLSLKVKNGSIDKSVPQSIGIFHGNRSGTKIALGGLDNTEVGILPINITMHWTENFDECNKLANRIFLSLLQTQNISVGNRKISCFNMIDGGPKDIGKTDRNISEMVLRVDTYYYLEEVII